MTRAAPVRAPGQGDRGQLPRHASRRASSRGAPIVLTERGDTVTENALMAAALCDSHHRDPQRQLQLHGPGPLLLPAEARRRHRGHRHHDADASPAAPRSTCDVDYAPSEDPIEAMSLLAAAIVTDSEITVKRVPIEFLEIELAVLEEMGFRYTALRGVRRRQRPHPPRRPHHPALGAARPASTRSTRCRSRASTSTTCRSSR